MLFDIPTLLVAVAVASACCALARFLLWRLHPGIPGLAHWAWASLFAPVALMLVAFRHIGPEGVWLSLSQVSIAVGFIIAWDGFRRFLGRRPLSRNLLVLLSIGCLVPVALSHYEGSIAARSVSNAVLVATVSGLIVRDLLRSKRIQKLTLRATAWLYVANAAFFLVRGSFALKDHGPMNGMWETGLAAITLLFWLSMSVALTLCMILMTGERLQEDLDDQASRDPLTGALNRRAFAQMAKKEVALAKRLGLPMSVLMMDLDHFKQINDRLGHSGGDAILCRFVTIAARELRGEDLFSRFGGEEFMALLPGSNALQGIAAAERLRTALVAEAADALPPGSKLPFPVSVSTGVAQIRPGEDLESAIWRADAALYRAKGLGRNRSELAQEPEAAA